MCNDYTFISVPTKNIMKINKDEKEIIASKFLALYNLQTIDEQECMGTAYQNNRGLN